MAKKLSITKNQIITLLLVAVVVISKTVITMLNQGNPGFMGMTLSIAMCVFFVLLFFGKFPMNKEEIFTGDGLIRVAGSLIIILWAFTYDYINFDYNIAMTALPIMMFCACDTKFLPVNVVLALGLTIRFVTAGIVSIPCAIAVSVVLIAPKLKEAKTWEKIVFAATMLCLIIDTVYIVVEMRFMFNFSSVLANRIISIILVLFAAFYIACMVLSLKTEKAPKTKKKSKKAVQPVKKADYISALGYLAAAVCAVAFTTLDVRFAMSGMVSMIMATLVLCKEGTFVKSLTDKAASALGALINKASVKNIAE